MVRDRTSQKGSEEAGELALAQDLRGDEALFSEEDRLSSFSMMVSNGD